ncbi:MAG: DNA polymerase IV [Cyclobacteriaceae bacterium]
MGASIEIGHPEKLQRKIIHVDMDAFYASVEQRDNPSLRGKPLAVGGSSDRGVVAAASYEARKYGVRSAMASSEAARRCKDLIFVRPRFDAYKKASDKIRSIFEDYTDLVEPLSLDEAYLDVTHNKVGIPSATLIAKEIKERIKSEVNLTASAGISINKFLAKTASDLDKPDGLSIILPEEAEAFVEKLPIHRFHGIGKVTAEKLKKMGVFTGKDLKMLTIVRLKSTFGKSGQYYFDIARAKDNRQVNPNRERKSIGAENTFSKDLFREADIREALDEIFNEVYRRIQKSKVKARTLTIKYKYHDFEVHTKSQSSTDMMESKEDFWDCYNTLFPQVSWEDKPIRLLGITVSNFSEIEPPPHPTSSQLTLQY